MNRIVGFVLIAACSMMGCEDNDKTVKGNIVGFVKLFDDMGEELADHSNVKVILDADHSALTDASGRFELKNVSAGTFRVTFEKEGYSSFEKFNFLFAAGSVPGVIADVKLIAVPAFTVLSQQVGISPDWVRLSATTTKSEGHYFFAYYFSDKPEVSNLDFVEQFTLSSCCAAQGNFSHSVPVPTSMTSPVYVIAYAASYGNFYGFFNYYSYEKQKTVNPAVKHLFGPFKVR